MRQEPNILECHDTSGEDSYLLKIRTDSAASLRALLGRIRDFPDVERTVTSISLCTIKESGGPPLFPVTPNHTNSKSPEAYQKQRYHHPSHRCNDVWPLS